jgi:lysophospholipase L1-like esterase
MTKSKGYQAISYSVGGQIDEVLDLFLRSAHTIQAYYPVITIIHVGHNDLAYHPKKNPFPSLSIPTAAATIDLANSVQIRLPNTSIFLSAPFPRSPKEKSRMSPAAVQQYNYVAKRHGQRIRTQASRIGLSHILNNRTWKNITQAVADEDLYLPDGLHLNPDGQVAVVDEWITSISANYHF